jgi:NADH dehydrogenase [ubiquinone] 1 alpha subcomplex assembly factor 7
MVKTGLVMSALAAFVCKNRRNLRRISRQADATDGFGFQGRFVRARAAIPCRGGAPFRPRARPRYAHGVTDSLRDRIRARIAATGPITFAEFMELSLYDPAEGFFARPSAGREFVTSAHVSPVFATLLARLLDQCFETLARPADFTVVDLGAGDGTLTRALRATTPYTIVPVERGAHARPAPGALAHADETSADAAASIEELAPFTGVVLANELFDNVPFHLVRDGKEVFVGARDDGFVEVEGAPTVDCAPAPGERTVSPQSAELVRGIAKALERGYAFAIDYGFVAGEDPEPVRAYAAHRMSADVLRAPGAHDVTGPVDFDYLARAATDAGLNVFGPVTQRDFLMNLGYRRALDEMGARQREAEQKGEWREAIAGFGARGEASMLVDPAGLGSLKVMAFATGGLPAPQALQSRPSLA